MSIQANGLLDSAGEFAEGRLALASGTWRCLSHALTVKVGRECPFCVQESLGDAAFEVWLTRNALKT